MTRTIRRHACIDFFLTARTSSLLPPNTHHHTHHHTHHTTTCTQNAEHERLRMSHTPARFSHTQAIERETHTHTQTNKQSNPQNLRAALTAVNVLLHPGKVQSNPISVLFKPFRSLSHKHTHTRRSRAKTGLRSVAGSVGWLVGWFV